MIFNTVNLGVLLCPTSLTWHAILAHGNVIALMALSLSLSLINGASFISDVVLLDLI